MFPRNFYYGKSWPLSGIFLWSYQWKYFHTSNEWALLLHVQHWCWLFYIYWNYKCKTTLFILLMVRVPMLAHYVEGYISWNGTCGKLLNHSKYCTNFANWRIPGYKTFVDWCSELEGRWHYWEIIVARLGLQSSLMPTCVGYFDNFMPSSLAYIEGI